MMIDKYRSYGWRVVLNNYNDVNKFWNEVFDSTIPFAKNVKLNVLCEICSDDIISDCIYYDGNNNTVNIGLKLFKNLNEHFIDRIIIGELKNLNNDTFDLYNEYNCYLIIHD